MVLDMPCPRCTRRPVDAALEFDTCLGILWSLRTQKHVEVACLPCAQKRVVGNTIAMLLTAPFGVFSWLVAPVFTLMNLAELTGFRSEERLRKALGEVGVDIDDVVLDAQGFTRERRACLDASLYAVTEAVWADGALDQRELSEAVRVVCTAFDGAIHPHEVVSRVRLRDVPDLDVEHMRPEYRIDTLRVACRVVAADGRVTAEELRFLENLARRLGLPAGLARDMLGMGHDSRNKSNRNRAGGGDSPLARAASVLGVDVDASLLAVKRAYRRLCMLHHPDRQGRDDARAKAAHDRMAELNWAYQVMTTRGQG